MAQHYSDPKHAHDKWTLPNIETWQEDAIDCPHCDTTMPISVFYNSDPCLDCGKSLLKYAMNMRNAWWYFYCLPGCMPDSDPCGPFETEAEALVDAREGMEDEESEGDAE